MRIFVLLAVLLAALGAASPAMAAASRDPGPAVRLVLERSGGIAGLHDAFVVDRTVAGSSSVLRLAGTTKFRRLGPSYQPANPCCDRFSYRLTVSYRGGSTRTVSTVDGAHAPRVLWDVIGAAQKVGTHRDPVPRV